MKLRKEGQYEKKKKWNKIIYCTGIILLGSSMALSLVACGKKDDETAVEQAVSQEETQNTEVLGEHSGPKVVSDTIKTKNQHWMLLIKKRQRD